MNHVPPTIDMLPDGTFRTQRRVGVPLSMKVGIGAALVAVIGLMLTIAAVAVYVVSLILPVIVIAAAVAWGALKFRGWQGRRDAPARPVRTRGFRQ